MCVCRRQAEFTVKHTTYNVRAEHLEMETHPLIDTYMDRPGAARELTNSMHDIQQSKEMTPNVYDITLLTTIGGGVSKGSGGAIESLVWSMCDSLHFTASLILSPLSPSTGGCSHSCCGLKARALHQLCEQQYSQTVRIRHPWFGLTCMCVGRTVTPGRPMTGIFSCAFLWQGQWTTSHSVMSHGQLWPCELTSQYNALYLYIQYSHTL